MRAVLYLRLSKEDVAGKRAGIDSIEVQRGDGVAAIQAAGFELVRVVADDDVSGTLIDRPGLEIIREMAKRHEMDVVAIRDPERLSRFEHPARTMALLLELHDQGVQAWNYREQKFLPLSGPEAIVTFVQAMNAAAYVTSNRKNIKDGLRRRVLEGRAVKQGPFGYRIQHGERGKRWVFDPQERDTLLHIGRVFAQVGSLNGAAASLNDQGIRSPEGGKWRANSVASILRRPLYRGYYQHGDLRVEHEEFEKLRIWPADLLVTIDQLLGEPKKPWGLTPRHLSTPFVRCGVCEGSMIATSSKRSKSTSLVCDRQRSRACEGIGYKVEPKVDSALLRAVGAVVADEMWKRTKELLREALAAQQQADRREAEIERARRDLQASERRARNLAESLAEAESGSERKHVQMALRAESERLEALRAAVARAEASHTPATPEAILDEAERRVLGLRDTLALTGIQAMPAVKAIMGEEKFRANLHPDGWELRSRVSTAHVFVDSSMRQKAPIKGTASASPDPGDATTVPTTTPSPSPVTPATTK